MNKMQNNISQSDLKIGDVLIAKTEVRYPHPENKDAYGKIYTGEIFIIVDIELIEIRPGRRNETRLLFTLLGKDRIISWKLHWVSIGAYMRTHDHRHIEDVFYV